MPPKKTADSSALQTLKRSLQQRQLRPLYFFHGEESYLREHYLTRIRKLLLDGPAESFNHHRFNAENFSVEVFSNAIEALPMMAENTLVEVSDVDPYKLPESDRERLVEIFSDIPDYCHVIFVFSGTFKPDKRLRKLHAVISKVASIVAFEKQPERDLIQWIGRHFQSRKKMISPELCRYLILRTGGTMTVLLSEIEKIAAYAQESQITQQQIDAVVEPVLDAYVFDMTDAVVAGKYGEALQILQVLFQMQQEPISLLGAVGTQFRRIFAAKRLQMVGQGVNTLMQMYAISNYPAQKVMGYAKRLSGNFCRRAMEACAQTDYQMKTSYDKPERLLELLLLRLAEENVRA